MGDETGYLLIVSDRFYKDLNKLSRQDQVRVRRALDDLRAHPYKRAKVQGVETGVYRWRVGSLRIRYDIEGKRLYVLRVLKRDVYRKA
jgi:mRNA-degrading endonuclease RelE of RelBE toxin-antitoxin system